MRLLIKDFLSVGTSDARMVCSCVSGKITLTKFWSVDIWRTQNIGRREDAQESTMRRYHVSENDLHEDMWLNGGVDDLEQIKVARIERSGEISIQRKPQVMDIHLADGVKIVRILIE